jgi:hypothetical protein
MKVVAQPDTGFFNRSARIAEQAVQAMGTVRGLYDAGKFIYGGVRAAAPLLAAL